MISLKIFSYFRILLFFKKFPVLYLKAFMHYYQPFVSLFCVVVSGKKLNEIMYNSHVDKPNLTFKCLKNTYVVFLKKLTG